MQQARHKHRDLSAVSSDRQPPKNYLGTAQLQLQAICNQMTDIWMEISGLRIGQSMRTATVTEMAKLQLLTT